MLCYAINVSGSVSSAVLCHLNVLGSVSSALLCHLNVSSSVSSALLHHLTMSGGVNKWECRNQDIVNAKGKRRQHQHSVCCLSAAV